MNRGGAVYASEKELVHVCGAYTNQLLPQLVIGRRTRCHANTNSRAAFICGDFSSVYLDSMGVVEGRESYDEALRGISDSNIDF